MSTPQPAGELAVRGPAPRSAGGTGLQIGVAVLWLSLIVLLPLAAIVVTAAEGGPGAFVSAVSSPSAHSATSLSRVDSAAARNALRR